MLCRPWEYLCRALFIQVWGTIYKLFMVEAYAQISFTKKNKEKSGPFTFYGIALSTYVTGDIDGV